MLEGGVTCMPNMPGLLVEDLGPNLQKESRVCFFGSRTV